MADDRLRLVAEVQDQFTGPLGKLETALGRAARTGTQAGKDLKKDFDGFHGSIGKANTALQSMTPVLSGLGVAGLATGVSLGAVTAALGGFSKGTQQLAIMSKETGLAVDQLRAFGALGERFGVSAETMQAGVRKFSDEMSMMRKRYGENYIALQNMGLGDLVEQLVSAPNMKAALDGFMERVSQIGDPVKRRKVVEMVLGSDQIAAVAGQLTGRYRQVMDEILKAQGTTTDAQVKAAQRFEDALSRVRENMDGLRTQALAPLLEELSRLVEKFSSADAIAAFSKQLEEIGRFARTTVQEFEAIVRTYEKFKEFVGLGDPSKNKEFTPVLGGPPGAKQLEGRRDSIEQQRRLLDANPSAPDYQRKRDRMTEELKRVGDELEKLRAGGATAQPSAYGGGVGGSGGLIHKTALGGLGGGGGSPGLGGFGGPLPTLGGGYGGGGGSGGGNPNVTGGGSGRGYGAPAISPAAPIPTLGGGPAVTANPGAYKDVLGHIAQSEGTAHKAGGGYNTSLGYGRYLPGRQEQNLTSMTLDQISALGNYMRRQPGNPNSSALGRYQIVGQTMRGLMRRMGLKGDELFDEKMQDRMGAELARGRGTNAAGLGQEWASLRGQRLARAVELMGRVDPRASTMPGSRAAEAEMSDTAGSGERVGDKVMRRAQEFHAPQVSGAGVGKGSLDITLHGFPAGTKPRASMDDLFKDVNVSKSRQMDTTSL